MSVNVTLTRSEDGQFTIDLGSAALPSITWNPSKLDPEVRKDEHMGARLLLAAALTCYINTMANDLNNAGAEQVHEIKANANIHKERDSTLRTRYTNIELNVEVPVDPQDSKAFESVRNNLLHGSLVTYSLEDEIDMDYNISAI